MFYYIWDKGSKPREPRTRRTLPVLDAGRRCGSFSGRLRSCLQACLQSPLPGNCVTRLGRSQPIKAKQRLRVRACIKPSAVGCQNTPCYPAAPGTPRSRERERNFPNPGRSLDTEKDFCLSLYLLRFKITGHFGWILSHFGLISNFRIALLGHFLALAKTSACSSWLTETVANPPKDCVFL